MFQKLQDRTANSLIRKNISKKDEIAQYVILFAATLFCLVIHAYLLVTFLVFLPFSAFVFLNALSVALYAALLVLHWRRRPYTLVAVSLSLQVSFYAMVMSYAVGIQTYVVGYFVLVFILQIILSYGTSLLRLSIFFASTAFAAASLLFHFVTAPPVRLPENLSNLLLVSNIIILFFGTTVQLLMGSVVNRIADTLTDIRLSELASLANTDPLTGLYNRRYAEIYLADILAGQDQTGYCAALLDIDNFKSINDTLGHHCGDEVLVFLSRFLTDHVRKTDRIFRWGGEEFLIILNGVTLLETHQLLDKLRAHLAAVPIRTGGGDVTLTITIGAASLNLLTPEESIARCDQNLYTGKRHGKNVVISE